MARTSNNLTPTQTSLVPALCCRGTTVLLLVLGGCASVEPTKVPDTKQQAPVPQVQKSPLPSSPRRGAYYLDDGPAEQIPEGLLDIPDAEPRIEPLATGPRRPYSVFGKNYLPISDNRPFVQRGIGSWYGKKFHGQRTASGEIYDMYKMTAAHPTLPIPSYARVTNLRNGKQITVRINDRGPFHSERIIDLSYTAALKLGYVGRGSSELEIERVLPEEIARLNAAKSRKAETFTALASAADEADPTARVTNTPQTPAITASDSGFYLQFGAYTQAANAQAMQARLLTGWPAGLPEPRLVQSGSMYRLHSGPFGSRDEASRAAIRLKADTQLQTSVVQK